MKSFNGPVFIVGMPRSGTKLLRTLLNQHSLIGITQVETAFLPYWVGHWESFGNLSQPRLFSRFYKKVIRSGYFSYMGDATRNSLISENDWYKACARFTPAGVFEALVRHDVDVPRDSDRIWGDKSPGYLTQLPLLRSLFPEARFIHIVRDVRDYCLSINGAWKKNMFRAAQRWADDITICQTDAAQFPQGYYELRFEDLLAQPEVEIRSLCRFLSLRYEAGMLKIPVPTENIGDAKGQSSIVANNLRKYIDRMDVGTRMRIESIASDILKSLGYDVEVTERYRVPAMRMRIYKILDGVNVVLARLRRRRSIASAGTLVRKLLQ